MSNVATANNLATFQFPALVSWEEFQLLDDDRLENSEHYELHDGEVVVVAPPRPRHKFIQIILTELLSFVKDSGLIVAPERTLPSCGELSVLDRRFDRCSPRRRLLHERSRPVEHLLTATYYRGAVFVRPQEERREHPGEDRQAAYRCHVQWHS